MTGRLPTPIQEVAGTSTVPVTAIGVPARLVVRYMIRQEFFTRLLASRGSSRNVIFSERMTSPLADGRVAGAS
jgi:hypothetical protein